MEGALRKLGVDPDTIVGNHSGMSSGPDAEDYLEGDLSQVSQSSLNKVMRWALFSNQNLRFGLVWVSLNIEF